MLSRREQVGLRVNSGSHEEANPLMNLKATVGAVAFSCLRPRPKRWQPSVASRRVVDLRFEGEHEPAGQRRGSQVLLQLPELSRERANVAEQPGGLIEDPVTCSKGSLGWEHEAKPDQRAATCTSAHLLHRVRTGDPGSCQVSALGEILNAPSRRPPPTDSGLSPECYGPLACSGSASR